MTMLDIDGYRGHCMCGIYFDLQYGVACEKSISKFGEHYETPIGQFRSDEKLSPVYLIVFSNPSQRVVFSVSGSIACEWFF